MDFVNQNSEITEWVKKNLELDCEEAKYVLRPWLVKTTVTREINENQCTCNVRISHFNFFLIINEKKKLI